MLELAIALALAVGASSLNRSTTQADPPDTQGGGGRTVDPPSSDGGS
jgi:hypothetical protein